MSVHTSLQTHTHTRTRTHTNTHTCTHFTGEERQKKVILPRVLNLGMWEQIGTHVMFVFVQPNISHQAGKLQALRTQFKQFYRLHFDLVSQYSKSLTKRLREGINIVRCKDPIFFYSHSGTCPDKLEQLLPSQTLTSASLVPMSSMRYFSFFFCSCIYMFYFFTWAGMCFSDVFSIAFFL